MTMLPISRRQLLQSATAAALAGPLLRPTTAAAAATTAVLPTGSLPKDRRLGDLKDLDGDFSWKPYSSPEAWAKRAEYVRKQVQVACGLWPMPARPRIEATIHGKVERDDYTVEKVSFESHAGLYVTGNLYRPKGKSGPHPAVLCPHGHWANGRFHDHGEAKVKQEIESGAETFPQGGRHPVQARCVHLARMGCVVFVYDMLGYCDNTTLTFDLIHRFGKQRPEMNAPDKFGLFSAQSELWLLNALGMQTWNSVRALDFLETLPDVDPKRMAVTGSSGGGTQTFLVGCVDPRPIAFFPAVMVSVAMQGGCTCENASYLRVGTGNIELAALLAPRTLGMAGALDWTREIETKGLPELKQHFAMLGVPDKVSGKFFPFEHNFNQTSRKMMYGVFRDALGLPSDASVEERDYVPLTQEEASVWDAAHPRPTITGAEAEYRVLGGFVDEFRDQLKSLAPKDAASFAEYRKIVGGGWDVLIGRRLENAGTMEVENTSESSGDGYRQFGTLVTNTTYGEQIPSLTLLPENWNQQLVIWLSDTGKSGLFDGDAIKPAVQKLLRAGYAVGAPDLIYQGEFLATGQTLTETRKVKNPREFVGFTVGYNHPLFSQRVHDVLTLIEAARTFRAPPSGIHLVAEGKAALYAAAAAAQSGNAIDKVALLSDGFEFVSVTEARDPMLLPGALRYGDVSGLLSLLAGHVVWAAGLKPETADAVKQAYAAVNATEKLRIAPAGATAIAAAEWIVS